MGPERLIPLTRSGQAPSTAPPIFERVGIVGLGLIGGSVALAARQVWPSSLVIGVDSHPVLERAVALHAVDVAATDLTIVNEADLVILAAPVPANIEILRRLPDYVERPVIVTDVGSTKRGSVAAAVGLPPHVTFVGGHPLAGSTAAGIDAARADLFGGRPWLFTPASNDERAEAASSRLFDFVGALGAVPRAMTADAHDHLVAFISHLPQIVASALMSVVGEAVGDEGLALGGRGLRDTTRLAASPSAIWTGICSSNADELGAAIDAIVEVLKNVRDGLARREVIEALFEEANRWRSQAAR